MSTHKNIDIICVVITILTIALTVLFMCGEALGITPIITDEADAGMFTDNDCKADWDSSEAVHITLQGNRAEIDGGNLAYFYDGDLVIGAAGKYVISGTLNDGSVIVDAERDSKVWILLNGTEIHCNDSAAFYIKQADKVFMTLADGTENKLSDGSTYSASAIDQKIDGTIYSKDDLTINGCGKLTVNGNYNHGIVCNDDFVITGGNITISAVKDAIHAHDSARIKDANIEIETGDDAIHANNDDNTGFVFVESGHINIRSCYEGIEAIKVTVAGGTVNIVSEDDGINACGDNVDSLIEITGGEIMIDNATGKDADGLDSNKDIIISGGKVVISVNGSGGTNNAIDYGSENGGTCKINGGSVIACGSSGMIEAIAPDSEQGFIMTNMTGSSGSSVVLKDASEKILINETIPNAFNCITVSAPGLKVGDQVTLKVGETQQQFTIDNSSLTGNMNIGGSQMPRQFNQGEQPSDQQMQEMPMKEMPQDKGEIPEKPDGMPQGERPEGMTKPESGNPDGMTPPDNVGKPEDNGQRREIPSDFVPEQEDQRNAPDDKMQQPEGEREQNLLNSEEKQVTILLLAVSFVVLAVGLIIAIVFRERE